MVETKREDQEQLRKVIYQNCQLIHPGDVLPDSPWFTRSTLNQLITDNLLKILVESNKKSKSFARHAAKYLALKKDEKENYQIKRASILRENIDILNILEKIKKLDAGASTGIIKIIKSQSFQGPVSVEITNEDRKIKLEEGDQSLLKFDFKGQITIELTIGQNKLYETIIKFEDVVNEVHYLKGSEKDVITKMTNIKGDGFSADIEVSISLSKHDKERILKDRLTKVEEQLKEDQQEFEEFYEELLRALNIEYNEEDSKYKSTYKKTKPKEDRFCDNCVLL